MSVWITVDKVFKEGLVILNKVDNGKLRLFVNHVCQSLRLGIDQKKIFSHEEKEKLTLSLNLRRNDVETLINVVVKIYADAAFGIIKPSVVDATMRESFNIDDEKVVILSQAWAIHAKGIIEAFRQKSTYPCQVTDINWNLDIEASSSTCAKTAQPLVKLQLDLNDSPCSKLTVEMDKQDLWQFYQNLEKIQTQLDALK